MCVLLVHRLRQHACGDAAVACRCACSCLVVPMSESALMSAAEAADLAATAEEEEELVSGSEDESGGLHCTYWLLAKAKHWQQQGHAHCAKARRYVACEQRVLACVDAELSSSIVVCELAASGSVVLCDCRRG